jgi:DNA repair protein RecO (recombination protein O)
MNKRLVLQPAYVLHRRAYRETSFLIELFTLELGRISVVAKGARKTNAALQGLLQPFVPLLISAGGKGELLNLSQAELNGEILRLQGEHLFAGFYLNELLISLLQKWDAHPTLYAMYARTLVNFQSQTLEHSLRAFEKLLLEELGYGFLFKTDILLQNTFCLEKYYRFIPEHGFVLTDTQPHTDATAANLFLGKNLLAIAQEEWHQDSLRDAKRLIRVILTPLLGSRMLHSRRLFLQPQQTFNHHSIEKVN